jgi:radical SAM protein with 4Fe4S-binding SPASM domain
MTVQEIDERANTTFNDTVKFSDYEKILAARFGERFRQYRIDYRKSLNYDKNGFIPDFPLTVTMELVNRCNLDCVMCYTVNHSEKKATLGLPNIKQVLAECNAHEMPALVIGLGSEPLIFKGATDVLKAAVDADVMDIFLGTNGVLMNERISGFLVENQISRVEISLDAATPETYKKVRGKNELEKIEANIHKLLEIKRRHNSDLPIVRLCFCVQDLNQHEHQAFLDKWQGVVDYVDFQRLLDHGDVDELREKGTIEGAEDLVPRSSHCAYPFNSLHVWANGDITPCCTFFAKSPALIMGNTAADTLEDVWRGEKLKALRGELLSGDLNPICRVCLTRRDAETFEELAEEHMQRETSA